MEETNLQKTTQISDATVVSPAQVPLKPFAPRLGIVLGLAGLAGLGAGLTAALLAGRRDVPALLAAREVVFEPTSAPAPLAAASLEAAAGPIAPAEVDDGPTAVDAADTAVADLDAEPLPIERPRPLASEPSSSRPPVRVHLALTPERIARLGGADETGAAPLDAFVETADGAEDTAGLAGLRRIAAELGADGRVRVDRKSVV
jgi:hypothetical protein